MANATDDHPFSGPQQGNFSSSSDYPTVSLSFADSLLYWSGIVCFAVGMPTNLLLLWLIRQRTRKEMLPFARILQQTAWFDLALLSSQFLWKPVFVVNERFTLGYGVGLVLADGTTSHAARWWNFVFYNIWYVVSSLALNATPAQFYYRFISTTICPVHFASPTASTIRSTPD